MKERGGERQPTLNRKTATKNTPTRDNSRMACSFSLFGTVYVTEAVLST